MESPATRSRRGQKNRSIRAVGVNVIMDASREHVKVACTDGAAWLNAQELRELADRMDLRARMLKEGR